jgi:methylated-DNA-[protein]-cysteine S-methyltransferase
MRAVGHANGSNPISVVIPCHRLIAANGALVKYGSGLARKRWLLTHEGVALKSGA